MRPILKPPPFLLGAGLLFWGWHGELLTAAIPMALVIEGARLMPWRWELEAKDFYRVADLCTVLFLGVIGYQFIGARFPEAMFMVLRWLPLAVFPLMLAESYSTQGRIPLEALFLTLRNPSRLKTEPLPAVNLGFPFAAICVLAAAAANPRTPWFFAALIGLVAWGLWAFRPRARAPALWGVLFVIAAGLGYAGQLGLTRLQAAIEDAVVAWLFDYDLQADPFKTHTRIGAIGKLKLSDRIILRVQEVRQGEQPRWLREAAYNTFGGGAWFARGARFDPVAPGADPRTWVLAKPGQPERSVAIAAHLKDGKGVLALPGNTTRISSLPALTVERSNAGAVRVADAPGFVTYRAHYGGLESSDAQPDAADLQIPGTLAPILERIARELGLGQKSPRQAVAAIEEFFRRDFGYSLFLGDRRSGVKSMEDFLTRSRAGHCEYFATATALLLRKAGIPARYAIGYAVQEYSPLSRQYLVRARHAHSWAIAYLDGAWREVDTTPGVWAALEEREASFWQPLLDAGSFAYYLFSRWRWSEREEGQPANVAWLAAPLAAFLLWRIFRRNKLRGSEKKLIGAPPAGDEREKPAFYRVVRYLEQLGHVRGRGETLRRWLERIRGEPAVAAASRELGEMLGLHYRLRFDPDGARDDARERLEAIAKTWLERYAAPRSTTADGSP